jgi:hypothetical protein
MTTADEFWGMAQDLYARARASIDPTTKRMLLRAADDWMKKAQEMRRPRAGRRSIQKGPLGWQPQRSPYDPPK